jgi:hypothetical protein
MIKACITMELLHEYINTPFHASPSIKVKTEPSTRVEVPENTYYFQVWDYNPHISIWGRTEGGMITTITKRFMWRYNSWECMEWTYRYEPYDKARPFRTNPFEREFNNDCDMPGKHSTGCNIPHDAHFPHSEFALNKIKEREDYEAKLAFYKERGVEIFAAKYGRKQAERFAFAAQIGCVAYDAAIAYLKANANTLPE